jgi:hypothetical protein
MGRGLTTMSLRSRCATKAAADCDLGLIGCASAAPTSAPPPAPQVDEQQVEQAISRMMGRAPAPQPHATPGGIEVVIGTGHSEAILAIAAIRLKR